MPASARIVKGLDRMWVPIGFFVAGIFFPALPWGVAVAVVAQPASLYFSIAHRSLLARWWQRSKPAFFKVLAGYTVQPIALHIAMMLFGNWIGTKF